MRLAIRSRPVYYGWVIIWTLAFTEMTSWGILYYTFAVMLTATQTETGWGRAELSGAFSLARLVSGCAGILIGRLLDRFGTRPIMTIGSCAAVLLVIGWSQAQTLTAFYLIWIGIGVAMAMVLYEPAFAAVATWFKTKRSQALTILTFGGGLASVVYVPLASWLLREQGWRAALLVLAGLLGLLTVPWHAWLLRRRPNPDENANLSQGETKPTLTLRTLLRLPKFWWLSLGFVASNFAASAMIFHLIPYLTDSGYSPTFAANAVGLVGATALPGRLIFTPLGARINRKWIAAGLFGMLALSFPVLMAARSEWGVIAFVLIFGAGYGAISPARAGLTADLFGAAQYGMVNGVVAFLVIIAGAIAPISISLLFTLTGDYTASLVLLLIVSGLSSLFVLRL